MEKVIAIPRKMIKSGGIVIIPRDEYEEFFRWKTFVKTFKAFRPTREQIKDLKSARSDYKNRKYLSLNELKSRVAGKN